MFYLDQNGKMWHLELVPEADAALDDGVRISVVGTEDTPLGKLIVLIVVLL